MRGVTVKQRSQHNRPILSAVSTTGWRPGESIVNRHSTTWLTFTDASEFGDDYVYVCQRAHCFRFFVPWLTEAYPAEEQNRWLVGHDLDTHALVVRCPQHITEHALRRVAGRIKALQEWAQQSQIDDASTAEQWSNMTPYPVDPRLLFHGDGTLRRMNGRRKRSRA